MNNYLYLFPLLLRERARVRGIKTMKINKVEHFKVVIPMKPGTVNSPQWGPPGFDEVPKFIVKVYTDAGITGIGETGRGAPKEAVEQGAAALLGQAPMKLNLAELPIPKNAAYDAYEMALFDTVGKTLDLPAYKLLGGGYRDRVLVDYWCGRKTPEDIAKTAKEGWDKGFKGLKMKCALEDPMVERVKAIAEVCPEMSITIDPNTRFYRPSAALELAKQMQGYKIEVFEDPVPKEDLDWYVFLRKELKKIGIPLALHLGGFKAVIEAIRRDCVDYLNLGGSMAHFVKLAAIAEAAEIPVWHGSGVDLGILDCSYVHACAAAKACTLASDIIGNFLREDDLILEPLQFKAGQALVPQKPGLGVELDEKAVKRYSVN